MSSTRKKLRAVFLTALMLGSVFAAGVAFTGSAAAGTSNTASEFELTPTSVGALDEPIEINFTTSTNQAEAVIAVDTNHDGYVNSSEIGAVVRDGGPGDQVDSDNKVGFTNTSTELGISSTGDFTVGVYEEDGTLGDGGETGSSANGASNLPADGSIQFNQLDQTTTLSVDTTGTENDVGTGPVNNLNTGEEFNSIQDAIDDTSTTNGDTIEVEDGTYTADDSTGDNGMNPAVTIDKAVTLQAANGATPTIDTTNDAGDDYGIVVNNPGGEVVIDGFEIVGDDTTKAGIGVKSGSKVTIKNNNIHGMAGYDLASSSGAPVSYGIHQYAAGGSSTGKLVVQSNEISNLGTTETGSHVHAIDTGVDGGLTIDGNTLSGFTSPGEANDGTLAEQVGIYAWAMNASDASSSTSITDNTITGIREGDTALHFDEENSLDAGATLDIKNNDFQSGDVLIDTGPSGNYPNDANDPGEFKSYAFDTDGNNLNINGFDASSSATTNEQLLALYNNNTIASQDATIDGEQYAVTYNRSTFVAGQEVTTETTVTGLDDSETINYALIKGWTGGTLQQTGSTSSETFTFTSSFGTTASTWAVAVSGSVSQASIGNTDSNNDGFNTISVEARNITEDVTITGDAVYNQTVDISGTLVDTSGEPVDGNTLHLNDTADDVQAVATTDSNGHFQFTGVELTDAGDWTILDEGTSVESEKTDSDAVVHTITVEAADANVTIEAAGNNFRNFEETYTINATSDAGEPLTQFDSTNSGAIDANDNFINVSGPFVGTSVGTASANDVVVSEGEVITSGTDSNGQNTTYVLVDPSESGGNGVVITAKPTVDTEDVTATLEVAAGGASVSDLIEGYEDATLGDTSAASPDLLGNDSAVTSSSQDDLLVDVPADNIEVTGAADAGGAQSFDVSVVGSDNNAPADGNALVNATVTISAPDIGIDEQSIFIDGGNEGQAGPTVTFDSLQPEQAGEVAIEVTANTSDGEVVTQSLTLPVVGDNYNSLSPTQATIDDSRQDISLQVTNADGTPLNNRIVTLTGPAGVFNVSSPQTSNDYETTSTLVIHGPDGQVKLGDGTVVQDFSSVNNGEYIAENVSFDTVATSDAAIDLEVATSAGDSRVDANDVLTVTGVSAYNVSSDRTAALAGANEVHNLTITEDGTIVNGSDLSAFTDGVTYEPSAEVTEVSSPSTVDTNDDGTVDALQVELRAENASAPLNITVNDGNQRTGTVSLDVVEPVVSTTLEGDLTFGLESEMNVTVEDPRDNTGIAGATVDLDAVNASFQYDNRSAGDDSLGAVSDATSVTVNENGTREIAVAPVAGTAQATPQTLNLSATIDSGEYGETAVNTGNITLKNTPANLDPSTEHSLVLNAVDANGNQLDLLGVTVTGSGLDGSAKSKLTDEGYVNFGITTSESGVITYNASESVTGSEITLVSKNDNPITVAQTNVYEQVNLSLSANTTSIQQNDTVMFTLTREDFNQQTTGTLTFTNESGDQIGSTSIQQTTNVTFETAGTITVTAEKPTRPQVGKAFLNDTVNVTVEEVVEPGAVDVANVNVDPSSVDSNTTNDHTVTFDAVNVSDDGNTDTLTVSFPSTTSVDNVNDVSVVDASGANVSVTSSAELVDNETAIEFSVSPDSNADYRDLTVTVDATVTASNVSTETTGDVTAAIADSSNGEDSASTTLTVTTQEVPPGAVYEAGSTADQYDGFGGSARDGQLSFDELTGAAQDYANNQLSFDELTNVAQAYANSEA